MTGKDLKSRIDSLGITQKKLAEMLEVTPQTISAILTAKDVRTSTIERMADALDLPISYFYDKNGSNAIASGDHSAASVHGNANVVTNDTAVLEERVKSLEAQLKDKDTLISEKERLIKILMEK